MAPDSSDGKLLVFDLDGTLADTALDLAASVNAALAAQSLPPLSVEQVVGFVGEGSAKLIERSVRAVGGAGTGEAVGTETAETETVGTETVGTETVGTETVGTETAGTETVGTETVVAETAKAFAAHYADHLMDNTRPYPDVDAVLHKLGKQHMLAVFSNKALKYITPIVVGLGWQDLFAAVLGGDWGGPPKPDPAGLLELCRRLGRSPSDSWMIGDGLTDMLAGRGAGMTTAAVTYGFKSRAQLHKGAPDFFIDALAELPALIGSPRA